MGSNYPQGQGRRASCALHKKRSATPRQHARRAADGPGRAYTREMMNRHVAIHAAVGAGAFAVTQYAMFAASTDPNLLDGAGWFLNGGGNILVMLSVLAAAAGALNVVAPPARLWPAAGAFGLGATAAMIATLFAIGPGSIFPIVIAFGAGVIAAATAAGTLIGRGVRRVIAT